MQQKSWEVSNTKDKKPHPNVVETERDMHMVPCQEEQVSYEKSAYEQSVQFLNVV